MRLFGPQFRKAPAAALCLGAVAVGVLDAGGFRPPQQLLFGSLALTAGLAAAWPGWKPVLHRARTPVPLALILLGGLGALSALWTVGDRGDALRWALVTVGYGALAIASAVISANRLGGRAIAGAILILATVSAIVGLNGAASHAEPFSDYVRGSWRPGGTLEYADAMALLAFSGLPAALSAMCARYVWVRLGGALCGAFLSFALALDLVRLELGFAACLAAVLLLWPERTVRAPRARGALALVGLVAAGLLAHLLYGRPAGEAAVPHAARELLGLTLLAGLMAALWLLSTSRPAQAAPSLPGRQRRARAPSFPPPRVALAIAATLLAIGTGALLSGGGSSPRYVSHTTAGGFWHGRLRLWQISIEAAADRPMYGFGADSFLAATIVRQRSSPIRFAHDLPLEVAVELGVPGMLLVLWLYATSGRLLWRSRRHGRAWLLGPPAAGFLAASLVDWPWHLAGSGAVFAVALGGLLGSSSNRKASP